MNPMLPLDIDGVLNNWTHDGKDPWVDPAGNPVRVFVPGPDIRPRIDAPNAEALEHILLTVGCVDIVLSSSWRRVLEIDVMQAWLRANGVPSANIVARTCIASRNECGGDHSRGGHVLATMRRMQARSGPRLWCALDDDTSIILPGLPHVHTDPDLGLTMTDAERAIALLTGGA